MMIAGDPSTFVLSDDARAILDRIFRARSVFRGRGPVPRLGTIHMAPEMREKLGPVPEDEPKAGRVGTLFGWPLVVDPELPPEPGFAIRPCR